MFNSDQLNDALFNKFVREIGAGDYIFKQGQRGNTMFVLVEGVVTVFFKNLNVDHLVGLAGSGEVIGEKAILSPKPYKRDFSAQAKTNCTLLEFDAQTVRTLSTKIPDFHAKILGLVADRLDKANQLISILQMNDPLERIARYMIYFQKHFASKAGARNEVSMTAQEIRFAVNVDKVFAQEVLKALVQKKILLQGRSGVILTDEDALLEYLPTLRDRVAA